MHSVPCSPGGSVSATRLQSQGRVATPTQLKGTFTKAQARKVHLTYNSYVHKTIGRSFQAYIFNVLNSYKTA